MQPGLWVTVQAIVSSLLLPSPVICIFLNLYDKNLHVYVWGDECEWVPVCLCVYVLGVYVWGVGGYGSVPVCLCACRSP